MKINLLYLLIILVTFGQNLFAQNNLDKVTLSFELNGEPTIESVGFDNPKNFWKVKYELIIVDEETYNKNIAEEARTKKYKKQGIRITKGSFKRKQLANTESRNLSVDVTFSDKIKRLIQPEKTYIFLFRTQTQVKTSLSKKKLKFKLDYPIMFDSESFLNNKTIGERATVYKSPDGRFGITILIK